jgi:hypothetical protein
MQDTTFITFWDYFLTPIYISIIIVFARYIRDQQYPVGHPWRPYFIPGLASKIVGAILIGMLYQYYYGGGDTSNYFEHAQTINSSFSDSPVKWFNLILRIPPWYDGEYSPYVSKMIWYESPSEYTVASIAAFIGVFTLTTYLPISIILGSLAFTGSWAMFRTFASQYPHLVRPIALCVLFIPSTIMWGSGLFKDTICMFGLGWMTYGAFRMLLLRDFSIKNIFLTLISFILIAKIKVYILLAFLPAVALWILFTYAYYIPTAAARVLVKLLVTAGCFFGFMFFSQKYAEELGRYSLDKIAKTSYITSTYISSVSGDDGSAYDLGELDPSINGMLRKFPLAVNVTLFRPYIWETRKPIQMLNALEASLFLWVTIKLFITIGFLRIWSAISEDTTIQFCLIFAIIFAFAIGLSSGNFGTLSRYRIPCLPFYGLSLVLIYYKYKPIDNNILAFNFR